MYLVYFLFYKIHKDDSLWDAHSFEHTDTKDGVAWFRRWGRIWGMLKEGNKYWQNTLCTIFHKQVKILLKTN